MNLSGSPLLPEKAVSECRYALATRGYVAVPDMLDRDACDVLKSALGRTLDNYQDRAVEQSRLDRYLIHDLLCQDPLFSTLLEDSRLQQLLAPLLGPSWIMYAFTSSSLPPRGTNYGNRIHVDCPRFVPGYTFNVGVMWALSHFDESNGATEVLPGSHHVEQTPDLETFDRNCVRVCCPQGSLIIFDARVFHRAGNNTTDEWRHALTMNACRSFMKQRFDWVRFIPSHISDRLNAQARRIIGFDTRLPTSLDEFFVPEEQRLYKSRQG